MKRKQTSPLKNRQGQVAFFIALIFQVLFLFFAMIVNVGLLVHHKINLQNSVDLASYYGALKQAEMMNAIGHINYQIRQSWKLLAFRYRQVGSSGDFDTHPLKKNGLPYRIPSNEEYPPQDANFYETPAFCITYVPFRPMPKDENTCRNIKDNSSIALWAKTPLIAGFLAFSKAFIDASEALKNSANSQCIYFGSFNWTMLAKFVVSFNFDQRDRNELIAHISNEMSQSATDFHDLNGDLVSEGIKNTLRKNLTYANNDGLDDNDIKIFNSLASDECNGSGRPSHLPPKWLTPVRIYPAFTYTDTKCDNRDQVSSIGRELNSFPGEPNQGGGLPTHFQDGLLQGKNRQLIEELKPYIGFPSQINDNHFLSIGVEKNPWCLAYVGVSAQARPKIPFAPFGGITLKARSYAKPFGGRIGPWYGRRWPRGSDHSEHSESDKSSITDPLLPPRVFDLSNLSPNTTTNKTRAANFSRYVGDKLGHMSRIAMSVYARGIYALDPTWAADMNYSTSSNGEPSFDLWQSLGNEFTVPGAGEGDIMAYDAQNRRESNLRAIEMSAILPDPFDMTYYSIEPDFYNNYFLKIQNFVKKVGAFKKLVRPDLGFRNDSPDLKEFNVIKQFDLVWKHKDLGYDFTNLIVNPLENIMTYVAKDWRSVLTGWAEKSLQDYSLDEDKFGKCRVSVQEGPVKDIPTSSSCLVGGRTGYSVKLVSRDYFSLQDLELGGENVRGSILNPPDPNF